MQKLLEAIKKLRFSREKVKSADFDDLTLAVTYEVLN